ncbi:sodium:proton antiporter [Methylicorpusculum oleiharenae]|uniref:cation:proton antiporter n=1 Tax=Methylicorpusculum oleiharenae TaxID=1338687 RepID=UPI00135CA308|nr:sodium:proton antiporter [Methylicorpusculum oleiharenae]MCD2450842.1 sodium:proton antiporter [Methylicorpusculum oleiharenae]
MNLEVFLSLFSLMLISLVVYMISQKARLPYTVLLVIVGSLLVPLSKLEAFAFINSFELTPELLFFVFLPILIFESAYNIKISDMLNNIRAISLLAVVGLLVSTFFIGVSGYYVFKWIGFEVPMIVTLLFGAIISSTDPVAVLSLFKEYGAPKRLTLMFEGESLFNDGTSFAIFLVMLEILVHGYAGSTSIISGLINFSMMLFGGILFGLAMGFLFAKLIEWVKGHEHLEITLTLLVAHFTFILTEVVSEHIIIAGYPVRFSSIIATLVASMVIGNFGRFKMSMPVEEYMEKFWSYFGFVTNSLVFILMGLLFVEQSIDLNVALMPILLSILVVMVGRALSIYPLLGLLNWTKKEEPIPLSWMHLLSWGSLRGSLAVIMVLLIPDDVTVPNWNYTFSVKEFITAITIGSIYFTLLVKATTIGKVMNKLGIDALTDYEEVSYFKSKALIYDEALVAIEKLFKNQQISEEQHKGMHSIYRTLHEQALKEYKQKFPNDSELTENLLRVYVLGTEKGELKEIYGRGEINEKIYKKILNLLDIQMERVEKGRLQLNAIDEKFPVDKIETFILSLRKMLFLSSSELKPQELYIYYRTQLHLLETVVSRLEGLSNTSLIEVFDDKDSLQRTIELYKALGKSTKERLDQMISSNYELLTHFNAITGKKTLDALQLETLDNLSKNEIISSKLYIMLSKELKQPH